MKWEPWRFGDNIHTGLHPSTLKGEVTRSPVVQYYADRQLISDGDVLVWRCPSLMVDSICKSPSVVWVWIVVVEERQAPRTDADPSLRATARQNPSAPLSPVRHPLLTCSMLLWETLPSAPWTKHSPRETVCISPHEVTPQHLALNKNPLVQSTHTHTWLLSWLINSEGWHWMHLTCFAS